MYTQCNTSFQPLNHQPLQMEMFNTTGFEVTDKVQVTIDKETYFGTILATDSDQNKIQVDYTAKSDKKPVIDWFQCSFWTKQATQKPL